MNASTVPRLINLQDYIHQRIHEVEALIQNTTTSTTDTSRRQRTHHRRRTKSYREPPPLEHSYWQTRGKKKWIRDRHRCRGKLQHKIDQQVDESTLKLLTHLWHVKRFHMIQKWGWLLPAQSMTTISCNARVLRTVKDQCILHDAGYWRSFFLSGHYFVLRDVLLSISNPHQIEAALQNETFTAGGLEGTFPIFEFRQYPKRFKGFVKAMLLSCPEDSESSKWLIWIHPSTLTDIQEQIEHGIKSLGLSPESISFASCPCKLQRLELCGHRSLRSLQAVIANLLPQPLCPKDNGRIVHFQCRDPRLTDQQQKDLGIENPASSLETSVHSSLIFTEELYPAPYREKEMNQLQRISKKRKIYAVLEKEEEAKFLHLADSCTIQKQNSGCLFVLGWMIHHTFGSCPCYSLILPNCWLLVFWKELVLKGCRVAGIEDWSNVQAALHLKPYPEAFPVSTNIEEYLYMHSQVHSCIEGSSFMHIVLKIHGKGKCLLDAQVLIKIGQDDVECGRVIFASKVGMDPYPGGIALCNVQRIGQGLGIQQEEVLNKSENPLQLLIKNPQGSVNRTAVGKISFLKSLDQEIL